MEIEQAIDLFRRAAIEKGNFAELASKDHALHDEMSLALRELEQLGEAGRSAFKAFLNDESPHVCSWAAAQLLSVGNQNGVPVLAALIASQSECKFEVEMVLREWRAGRFGSPLGDPSA